MLNIIKLEAKNRKLTKRINELENENEILKTTLKDELYIAIINKVGEPEVIKKLEKENQQLRKNKKELKELLKESESKKR